MKFQRGMGAVLAAFLAMNATPLATNLQAAAESALDQPALQSAQQPLQSEDKPSSVAPEQQTPETGTEQGDPQVTPETDPSEDQGKGKRRTLYAKKKVKIYSKRKTSSGVVGTIPKDTKILITKISGGWGSASYDGMSGFVRVNKFTAKKPIIEEETPVEEPGSNPDVPVEGGPETPGVPNTPDEMIEGENAGQSVGGKTGLTKVDRSRTKGKDWSGQIVLAEGGMPIPVLYQTDYRKVVCIYSGIKRSVSTSGCSTTALSMVIAYLTGNTEQTPHTLFREAVQSGMYHGNGLARRQVKKIADANGIHGVWTKLDADGIISTLKEGKPIIVNVGPGYFTERGHYIVLRGVTDDGLILVNDPASAERSANGYPVGIFLEQRRSADSFMVCTVAEVKEEEKAEETEKAEPQAEAVEEPVADVKPDEES